MPINVEVNLEFRNGTEIKETTSEADVSLRFLIRFTIIKFNFKNSEFIR